MKHSFLLCLLFFSQCISSADTDNQKKLQVAVPIEARGLYPYEANDPHSLRIYSQIFDTLIARDQNNELIPALATSWRFINPITLELEIRSNVKFHNGDLLTVEDVDFSLQQILKTPHLAHTVISVKESKIINSNTIHIILKESYPAITSLLASPVLSIVNKKAVLEYGADKASKPIGTGAYQLAQWNRGESITLKRFDEYWQTPANIEEIELRTIPDVAARAISLEAGDVDMAFDIEGSDIERMASNSELVLYGIETPRVEYLAMNIGKGTNPLWKTKEGRQALEWLIDKQGIIDSVLFGSAKPANSLVPPVIKGHDSTIPIRQNNLERAKQLLSKINISNASANILVTEGNSQKVAEIIQAALLNVGINTSIQVVEYGRFIEMIAQGTHDLFILNWTVATGDADYSVNNLLNSKSWGSKGNRSFYDSPVMDSLLQLAKTEQNPEKRIEYYKQIQKIAYDEVPYIPLFYPIINIGASKKVQNVQIDIFTSVLFSKLTF